MANKWFLLLGLVVCLSASHNGYTQEVRDMDIVEVGRLLLGKWVSTADSLAVIEFTPNHTYYHYYYEDGLRSEENDYEVSLDLPAGLDFYRMSEKRKFLYVYILNEETGRIMSHLDYEIVSLKEDSYLSLLYLGGRLLNYRKVKE